MGVHLTTLFARSYECDVNGHVNHAVYANYLEHARMQFLLANGFDYTGFLTAGFRLVVTRIDIRYRLPVFAQDELTIETVPTETRRIHGIIHQVIRRGGDEILSADVYWAVVNAQGRPAKLPHNFSFELWGAGASPTPAP